MKIEKRVCCACLLDSSLSPSVLCGNKADLLDSPVVAVVANTENKDCLSNAFRSVFDVS